MENPVAKVIYRIAHREYSARYGFPCEHMEEPEFQEILQEVIDATRERWERDLDREWTRQP